MEAMMRNTVSSAFFALATFVSVASAAEVWWNAEGVGAQAPKNWYSYTSPEKGSDMSVKFTEPDSTDVPYVVSATFSASVESTKDEAGIGFVWKINKNYTETTYDISAHKGVCMSYSSTGPIRMSFKQFNIEDFNYYGYSLPSTEGKNKTMFVDFGSLTQAWESKGTTMVLNLRQQLALQFAYKGESIKKFGTTNTLTITALALADECETSAPEVIAGNPTSYELYEGKSLDIALNKIFKDADGDDLQIVISTSGSGVVRKDAQDEFYSLDDVITFVTTANPKATDSMTVTLTATDPTNKTAKFVFGIKPIDTQNVPVVRDTAFEVAEGETLSTGRFSLYSLASDADGDDLTVEIADLPEHGSLSFDEDRGSFTYTPDEGFYGVDKFTYVAYETAADTSVSEPGTVTITVSHINAPPTVSVEDPFNAFEYYFAEGAIIDGNMVGDTLKVDEDFDTLWVEFRSNNVVFADPDGPSLDVTAKSDGVVKVDFTTLGKIYQIQVTSIQNANGVAKVMLVGTDGQYENKEVYFYVAVKPVADPPKASDDSYDAKEDVKLSVTAAKGVLANDVNPDDESVELTAALVKDATHGKVTLKDDGSFTYMPEEDYFGEDAFTYVAVNEDGDTSNVATVTITVADMPEPPKLAIDIASLDTTMTEDGSALTYTDKVVKTWVVADAKAKLTFDFKADDDKVTIKTSAGGWWVMPNKDAFGETSVTVSVSDGVAEPLEFQIKIFIKPMNDAPVVAQRDTFEVKNSDWEVSVNLDSLFRDVDGDTLTYEPIKATNFKTVVKDNKFIIAPATDSTVIKDGLYRIKIRAFDKTDTTTATILLIVGKGAAESIAPSVAMAKVLWQNAIMATRGSVAIMDMQGRVMWKAKLPVSEADVRNASAQVQGRKVLRVNKQTWTIK